MTKQIRYRFRIFSLIFLSTSTFAFSQIKEEQLILDRKREPKVKKIEKKQTSVAVEKDYPPKEKKKQDSLGIKYEITDVPAVSDFKTSKIQGVDIAPSLTTQYQKNYFRAGIGNYGRVLADATFMKSIDGKNDAGIDFHHVSTSGLRKDYGWKSFQQSLGAEAFISGRPDGGKYNVSASYRNDAYNYYGIYALSPAADTDLKQSVNRFGLRGFYDFYDNPVIEKISVKAGYLGDHFGTRENAYQIQAMLKHEWDVKNREGMKLSLEGDTEFKGLNTKFGILDQNTANHFIIEFSPMLRLKKGESFIAIGANMNWITQHNEVLSEDSSSNDFSIIPQIAGQYFFRPQFIVYGGLDGGIMLNSYGELLSKNPYLVSNQILKPTDTKYRITLGIKGDIAPDLKYNVSGAYSELDNFAVFQQNGFLSNPADARRAPYDYLNTFSADYSSGKLAELKGEINYLPLQNLSLDAEVSMGKYDLEDGGKMYATPLVKSTFTARYTTMREKLILGFTGIFASGTTTNTFAFDGDGLREDKDTSVSGYADLNLSAEYRFHKNFSIFALGNNLLNQKYQNFYGYKNLGAQILGGLKVSF